jgi:hypothetical protein
MKSSNLQKSAVRGRIYAVFTFFAISYTKAILPICDNFVISKRQCCICKCYLPLQVCVALLDKCKWYEPETKKSSKGISLYEKLKTKYPLTLKLSRY